VIEGLLDGGIGRLQHGKKLRHEYRRIGLDQVSGGTALSTTLPGRRYGGRARRRRCESAARTDWRAMQSTMATLTARGMARQFGENFVETEAVALDVAFIPDLRIDRDQVALPV